MNSLLPTRSQTQACWNYEPRDTDSKSKFYSICYHLGERPHLHCQRPHLQKRFNEVRQLAPIPEALPSSTQEKSCIHDTNMSVKHTGTSVHMLRCLGYMVSPLHFKVINNLSDKYASQASI